MKLNRSKKAFFSAWLSNEKHTCKKHCKIKSCSLTNLIFSNKLEFFITRTSAAGLNNLCCQQTILSKNNYFFSPYTWRKCCYLPMRILMHAQFKYRVFMCGDNLGGQVLFPMNFFSDRLKLVSIHKTCTSKIHLYSGMPRWRQTHYEHKIPHSRRAPAFHTAFISLGTKISLRPLDITATNRSSFPEIKGQTAIIIFALLITDLKLMYSGGGEAYWLI